MTIQSLDYTSQIVERYISKRPRARLLTLYRLIRKRDDHSLIGSWPIIAEIFFTLSDKLRPMSAKELVNTCRNSDDPELQRVRSHSALVLQLFKEAELKQA